jgi:hypothetical protein
MTNDYSALLIVGVQSVAHNITADRPPKDTSFIYPVPPGCGC